MNESEAINLLRDAAFEIKTLRAQNERMAGRLEMFDSVMQLFHTQPHYQSRGMTEDVVWKIDKFITSEMNPKDVPAGT